MLMLMVVMLMHKKSEHVLKRLFKPHKRIVGNVGDDSYFKEILDAPMILKVALFGSKYDINAKECCKSKDGTCATMECIHNHRRYGDDIYEIVKDVE